MLMEGCVQGRRHASVHQLSHLCVHVARCIVFPYWRPHWDICAAKFVSHEIAFCVEARVAGTTSVVRYSVSCFGPLAARRELLT